MSVSVRRVRADEGTAFRAIRLQAIGDSPTAFGSTLAETAARPPGYWEDRVGRGAAGEESVLFVADDAGRWVGIIGGFVDDAGPFRRVDLVSMWVNPEYRGRGIARDLVDRLIAWARERGGREVVLWVTEDNASAIRLYRAAGFEETGETQPLPSHSGLMEIQMILSLS